MKVSKRSVEQVHDLKDSKQLSCRQKPKTPELHITKKKKEEDVPNQVSLCRYDLPKLVSKNETDEQWDPGIYRIIYRLLEIIGA